MTQKRRVTYYYDEELAYFSYGEANPMRPYRLKLTHNLVQNYQLDKELIILRPELQNFSDFTQFHADEYIKFLQYITPENKNLFMNQLRRFNVGCAGESDCPVFNGIFEYCQTYTGGSIGGAARLAQKTSDVCINWAGGMHHAKKAEASGFCYINDIVLAIIELLKEYQRVLYVDIDIHHGDGVEEAFYRTNRVLTVSFHKHGDFFPGTGALGDIGYENGKYYALNVPLREGMDDESYKFIFEPIIAKVMTAYQPEAIVICAGADSLAGDRIGCFNLSLEGHSNCLEFLATYNLPMLVVGGGGYTLRNVARCWTFETAKMLGIDLPDDIPMRTSENYLQKFTDTGRLRIQTSNMKNANSKSQLHSTMCTIMERLQRLEASPSVPFQECPPSINMEDTKEENPDEKGGGQLFDEQRVNDYYSDNDEEEYSESCHGSGSHKRSRIDTEADHDTIIIASLNNQVNEMNIEENGSDNENNLDHDDDMMSNT